MRGWRGCWGWCSGRLMATALACALLAAACSAAPEAADGGADRGSSEAEVPARCTPDVRYIDDRFETLPRRQEAIDPDDLVRPTDDRTLTVVETDAAHSTFLTYWESEVTPFEATVHMVRGPIPEGVVGVRVTALVNGRPTRVEVGGEAVPFAAFELGPDGRGSTTIAIAHEAFRRGLNDLHLYAHLRFEGDARSRLLQAKQMTVFSEVESDSFLAGHTSTETMDEPRFPARNTSGGSYAFDTRSPGVPLTTYREATNDPAETPIERLRVRAQLNDEAFECRDRGVGYLVVVRDGVPIDHEPMAFSLRFDTSVVIDPPDDLLSSASAGELLRANVVFVGRPLESAFGEPTPQWAKATRVFTVLGD